ncbi:MAG: MFS transporter, partial [Actinomycetota bacterium]
ATILAGTSFIMIGGFDALWALVHDELETPEWIANLGITLFALPLIVLGPPGGRIAQTFGPFRIAAIGLIGGAGFMFGYGLMPTGIAIFVLSLFHALNDGFTIASTGVAAGLVVPEERQAGAQGMLGASQAVMAGVMAFVTGYIYEWFGRTAAYSLVAGVMIVLVALGLWLARDAWSLRRPLSASGEVHSVDPAESVVARRAGPADPAIVNDP